MSSSRHATKRLRERLGLAKKGVDREIARVLERGRTVEEFEGALLRYLRKIELKSPDKALLVYGNNMYMFGLDYDEPELVTAWPIPTKYRKASRGKEYEYPNEEVGYEEKEKV